MCHVHNPTCNSLYDLTCNNTGARKPATLHISSGEPHETFRESHTGSQETGSTMESFTSVMHGRLHSHAAKLTRMCVR